MRNDSNPLLTPMLAYKAMFEFLTAYQSRGPSEDIDCLLSGLSLLEDQSSADPAFKSDWLLAVMTVLEAEQTDRGYQPIKFRLTN